MDELTEIQAENTEDNSKLLAEIRDRIQQNQAVYEKIDERITEDFNFASLQQWTADEIAVRDGRPTLTVSKINKYIDKIVGHFRQTPTQAAVRPRYGTSKDVALIAKGYLRKFLAGQQGRLAVQASVDNLARAGYAYLYVSYELESERSFDEYLPVLKGIKDPRMVRMSRYEDVDGSDANWCALLSRLERSNAEALYGETVTDQRLVDNDHYDTWFDEECVTVADYWYTENYEEDLYEVRDRMSGKVRRLYASELSAKGDIATRYIILKQRKANRKRVMHCKVVGADIVEKNEWPGPDLPIIPMLGKPLWIDTTCFYTGIVRQLMDAQRLINYYASTIAETTALSPRAPWIITEGQLEGHEDEWTGAGTENKPYLTYKGTGEPPPSRNSAGADISGLLAALQQATADLTDVSGIYEASLGAESSQESGKAITEAAKNTDQTISILKDSVSRAVIRAAQVALRMLPKLVTGERTLAVLTEEGEELEVPVNAGPQDIEFPGIEEETPDIDLSDADLQVVIEEGASYQSRAEEAAKGSIEILGQLPEAQRGAVAAEAVRVQPWANAKKMSRIIASTLPPEMRAVVLGDENSKEDPQAKAILDGMKAEIERGNQEREMLEQALMEAKFAMQQLQLAVISTRDDNETKERIAYNNNLTNIEVAQIKAGSEEQQTMLEGQLDVTLAKLDARSKAKQQRVDSALKIVEKFLGTPAMGPTGTVNGQLRGMPGVLTSQG